MNRNKAKGDQFERDVLKTVHQYFPTATRTRPGRMEDEGDIQFNGCILQAKDHAKPTIRAWLKQLAEQKANAKAFHAAVVWKIRGYGGKPPVQLVIVELSDYLELVQEAGY